MTKYIALTFIIAFAIFGAPLVFAQKEGKSAVTSCCGAMSQRIFDSVDTDKNGAVTQEEFTAFHAQKFGALDTDGDGVLSKEEMKKQAQSRKIKQCTSMGCQCQNANSSAAPSLEDEEEEKAN